MSNVRMSAEAYGRLSTLIERDEYNEVLNNLGKSEEEFVSFLQESIDKTFQAMEDDKSLYEYKRQSEYVELENITVINVEENEEGIAIITDYSGTEYADGYIRTSPRTEPDDDWTCVEDAPDDFEMPDMVEKIIDKTLENMNFKCYNTEIEDCKIPDWEEELASVDLEPDYDDYYDDYER